MCSFLFVDNTNRLCILHGSWDVNLQRYQGHDLDLLESHDVICHVTTGFAIFGFLQVVNLNQPSISHGSWDSGGSRTYLLGSRDTAVTWPWTSDMQFPTGDPSKPSLYLASFLGYYLSNTSPSIFPFKMHWSSFLCFRGQNWGVTAFCNFVLIAAAEARRLSS